MFYELLITAVTLFIFLLRRLFKRDENLPPGPKNYPLIGSLLSLSKHGKNLPPFLSLAKLGKKYGPIMYIEIGMSKQVIVQDIELARELLNKDIWLDRYYDNYWAERSFGKHLGILLVSGESWKEMRRFCLRTLRDFGFGKQKSMESVIAEELADLMGRINTQLNTDPTASFPMNKFFSVSVLNILWSMMAGYRFSYQDHRLRELIDMMDVMLKLNPIGANIFQMFPFLWHITPQVTKAAKQRIVLRRKLHNFFNSIVDERREEGIYKDEQRDFIDVFLKEIDNTKSGESKNPKAHLYTDEQFIVVVLDLYAAGSETTSNTLEFAFLYMLLNPDVMKKVQNEIDTVVGRSRLPSPFDRPNMPYTEATILEIQRVANVVPLLLRSPIEDTIVNKHSVKKGTHGVFNLHAMHMNPENFPQPEKFDPERFLDAEGKLANVHKILPFGIGKRVCIGESLSKVTLFTYFTGLLQNYNFEIPKGETPVMDPVIGFTLSPTPYSAVITPR